MSEMAETMAERHGRMLAEAAEIMLASMRRLAGRLEAAETPDAERDAALALQRVNRGLRQTILLEARLAKDRVELDRRQAERAEAVRKEAAKETAARLKVRARRVVLDSSDSYEAAEPLLDNLELWVEDYAVDAEGTDFEALVITLCRDLGIAFEPHELPASMREGPAGPPPLVQAPDLGWTPNTS
jgi:hypothetical protein